MKFIPRNLSGKSDLDYVRCDATECIAPNQFKDKALIGGFMDLFSIFKRKKNKINIDRIVSDLSNTTYICKYNLPIFYPIKQYVNVVIYMINFNNRSEKILQPLKYYSKCYYYNNNKHLYFFIDNWRSLKYVSDVIREYLIVSYSNIDTKIQIINANINKFNSYREVNYKRLIDYLTTHHNGVKLTSLYIEFNTNMIPNGYIQHGKLINKPPVYSAPIKMVRLYYGATHTISSLKIKEDGLNNIVHPNCDKDGWYCLGDYKNIKMNPENIEKVLDHLKIYNLDDSYTK